MARSVRVGDFQRMQRTNGGPNAVAAEATVAPPDGEGIDVATAPNVPEQLAALELHVSANPPYDEVVRRLKVRASLLDIPALDEGIAAEARRRCGMLPEPTTVEESDFVDDQRPYADEDPEELREPPVEPWPHGTAVVAQIGEHTIAGRYLTTQDHGDGPVLGIELPSVNLNWGIGEAGLHWLSPEQVSLAEPPVELMPDDQAEPMEDRLADLDVGARCTAEMSLSMIVGRIKDAAFDAKLDPTDAEVVAEAERIWCSFDVNRKGPREATINADGTVRDWRRPDTTPDRGPDVGTTVHTVGDEQRFSGAGAEDAQQRALFPVPEDRQFNGKLYRDAPELAIIAEKLIGEHGFLEGLVNCEIRYYWRRKTGVSKGRVKIGYCKRASDLLGHFSNADFIIWLSATTARDGKFTDRQVEAAIFHQLLHIETDDEGNFISARHDFEGFAQEIRHYGTWTEDLKLVVPAFTAAQQMGLFDVDDDGIEDEEDEDGDDPLTDVPFA